MVFVCVVGSIRNPARGLEESPAEGGGSRWGPNWTSGKWASCASLTAIRPSLCAPPSGMTRSDSTLPSESTVNVELNEDLVNHEDDFPNLSQQSELSVLEDGPPTKRRRLWGHGPPLTQRIHNVLDALKTNGFTSGIDFLLPIFYGDKDLRADERAKTFRRRFTTDENLSTLLWNLLDPPRTKAKGAKASAGPEKLQTWAFEATQRVLRRELISFGTTLYPDGLCSVPEEADTHSLNESVLKDMKRHSPMLLGLLSNISEPISEPDTTAKLQCRVRA
jgi:hypothetical protein